MIETRSPSPCSQYSKLFIPSEKSTSGISLELIQTPCGGDRLFVVATICPVVPNCENGSCHRVTYTRSGIEHTAEAYVFGGGQKLEFSAEDTGRILTALMQCDPVEVKFGMYRATFKDPKAAKYLRKLAESNSL